MSGHGAGFYGMRWVELTCINLGESDAFVGGKVFEKLALSALSALPKAERGSVQLWETVHFREIIPALLLHFLHFLPPPGPFQG